MAATLGLPTGPTGGMPPAVDPSPAAADPVPHPEANNEAAPAQHQAQPNTSDTAGVMGQMAGVLERVCRDLCSKFDDSRQLGAAGSHRKQQVPCYGQGLHA